MVVLSMHSDFFASHWSGDKVDLGSRKRVRLLTIVLLSLSIA